MSSENEKIIKAAGVVGSATMLSRILGFVRDVLIASIFGASLSADAFFVAFRIPNLFRRFTGEGSLTASFIPVFTEFLSTHSKKDARRLVGSAFIVFALLLALLTILGIIFSPFLVELISPGFGETSGKLDLTIKLTRFMFPYLFFVSLVALCMGILNSLKHFAAPALAPVLLNISIISTILFLSGYLEEPVFALAIGVILGGILQLLFQIPFLRAYEMLPIFNTSLLSPPLKKIGMLMIPSIIGLSVHQLNILVTTRFASNLADGSVSYLYYADRLVELPLGVFGISLATAILPSLSEYAFKGEKDKLKETLSYSLRLVLFISIPSMIGLIILREPIISVLFQRGEFTHADTLGTAHALLYYSFGVAAFSAVRILASVFFSLKDTLTPVKVAGVSVFVNLIFCLILIGPLRHGGLALATSLASILNVVLLFAILRKRLGSILEKGFALSVLKISIASVIMGILVYYISSFGDWAEGTFLVKLSLLFFSLVVGSVTFFFFTYILKCQELRAIKDLLRRR
ncbi:MAG: murein biosynthesis integral membrane protein MurJ [Thermodesulfobacteriota bacterium]